MAGGQSGYESLFGIDALGVALELLSGGGRNDDVVESIVHGPKAH